MKGEQPEISVIVPVYNAAPYLSECVESVLGQTLADFELWLVDDGSTDGSGALCDEKALKDSRIHVLHQNNRGVSAARNAGLDKAAGTYLMFLDADDLLTPDALQQCRSRMDGADMAAGGIRRFDENGDAGCITVDKEMACGRDGSLSLFLPPESGEADCHRFLFNRMLRTEVVRQNGLRFCEDIAYKEDGLFVVQYICRSTRPARFFPDIIYRYRQTADSAMGRLQSGYSARLLTNVDAHGAILREMKRSGAAAGLIQRERLCLFRNYSWIRSVMAVSGADNMTNRARLLGRLLLNGGPAAFIQQAAASLARRKKQRNA